VQLVEELGYRLVSLGFDSQQSRMSLLCSAQISCEDCIAFCSAGIGGGCFARSKAVNHSPPSSAEVTNDWSCTSTPLIYVHGMGRDNFTFTLPFTVPFAIL